MLLDERKSKHYPLRNATCIGLVSPTPMADHPRGGIPKGPAVQLRAQASRCLPMQGTRGAQTLSPALPARQPREAFPLMNSPTGPKSLHPTAASREDGAAVSMQERRAGGSTCRSRSGLRTTLLALVRRADAGRLGSTMQRLWGISPARAGGLWCGMSQLTHMLGFFTGAVSKILTCCKSACIGNQ